MRVLVQYVAGLACASVCALAIQAMSQVTHANEVAGGRSSAGVIRGFARVIDGDTLEIEGQRVRLEGIDAPEINQSCQGQGARQWPAGRIAAAALARWVDGREVVCRRVGRDVYGRAIGRCRAAGKDLNAALIDTGLAWAFRKYSRTFVRKEQAARASGVGLWAHRCQTAWEFRSNRWQAVAERAPSGCAIKGNITRRGRIYHMPWSPWYGRTRIEETKGERWFCDERQALAAGWRPALVR